MAKVHPSFLARQITITLTSKEGVLSSPVDASLKELPLNHRKTCPVCHQEFDACRSDKKTCSGRCRQRLSVAQKEFMLPPQEDAQTFPLQHLKPAGRLENNFAEDHLPRTKMPTLAHSPFYEGSEGKALASSYREAFGLIPLLINECSKHALHFCLLAREECIAMLAHSPIMEQRMHGYTYSYHTYRNPAQTMLKNLPAYTHSLAMDKKISICEHTLLLHIYDFLYYEPLLAKPVGCEEENLAASLFREACEQMYVDAHLGIHQATYRLQKLYHQAQTGFAAHRLEPPIPSFGKACIVILK